MPSEKDNISWEIVEHLGVISTGNNGWSTELNLVAWNGNKPKFDVRGWDQDHEHMGRGVTLHEGEFRKMIELFFKHNSRKVVGKAKAEQAEREERSRQYTPYGNSGNRSSRSDDAEEPVSRKEPEAREEPTGAETEGEPAGADDDLDPEALLTGIPDGEPAGEAFTATDDETPF